MKTPHTPGPWNLQQSRDGGQSMSILHTDTQAEHGERVPESGITWQVASVNLCMGAESEANARLIAAAPDLLAVIQSLPPIDAPDFRERYVALLNGPARSAIAKAQA